MLVIKSWRRGTQTLYTTKHDGHGMVSTDEQGAA